MMSKALWIDSSKKQITEVEVDGLADLNHYVGGDIRMAARFRNGDVIYVDDNGLHNHPDRFFKIDSRDQPLAGDGLLVGPEIEIADDDKAGLLAHPQGYYLADYGMPKDAVERFVRFLSPEQVKAWGKANASEPAISITMMDDRGNAKTTVLKTYGDLYKEVFGDKK